MIVVWILFGCSLVVLPAVALLGLRWAVRHGEFRDMQKIALSIFDDDEPVGQMTDRFPDAAQAPKPTADPARHGPGAASPQHPNRLS